MTGSPAPDADVDGPPEWLLRAEDNLRGDLPEWFTRFAPPVDPARRSAVLILVGPDPRGTRGGDPAQGAGHDIVLTERSGHLRSHAGQVSFPGGGLEPGESAVDAALRETWEEVGIEPDEVDVVGSFPDLWLSPSRNAVTPVLGWWPASAGLDLVNPGEVARVERVPVVDLLDPANRFTVKAPSGYVGPGFDVADLFVWGFTAQLLTVLFDAAELTVPWDEAVRRRLPWRFVRPYLKPGARGRASR